MLPSNCAFVALVVGNLLSLSWWRATAFAPSNRMRCQRARHVASGRTELTASIYYPDDDDGGYYREEASSATATSDEIFGTGGGVYGMSLFGQLAAQLSSDPSVTSTLAKLASAFSPPGFAIELANVNDVRCLSLDNRHMEIEAVVCDDVECSSLLVPVDFPHECNVDEGFADCILRNVGELDAAGEHVLLERGCVFAQQEEAQKALEALRSLDSVHHRSTSGGLPGWWVPPTTSEDVSECKLLQDLLNREDMQDMVQALATNVLRRSEEMVDGGWVRSVRVKAVGPEGMVLKLHYSLGGKTWEDDGGLNNEAVVDVPIRFGDMTPPGYGRRSIREEVLNLVGM